jgi:hypothetical protein
MEDIYWRVFRTNIVTNNEIPTWIVHGFIARSKGHPINWAKVVKSTAKKKACQDGVKVGHLMVVKKKHTTNSLELSGGSLNPSSNQHMSLQFVAIGSKHGASVVPNDDNIEQMSLPTSKCHIGMSFKDIKKVTELLALKKELLIICKAKIKSLKMDEGVASTKLLGIKYNLDEKKKMVEEAQATLNVEKNTLSDL